MDDTQIAAVRSFNRFYTRQLGLLDEHIAQSRFSLAEGRVLYELAKDGECSAGALAASLNLDPAYLSRILARLSVLRLVVNLPDPADRRRSLVSATADGRAAVAELEDLNNRAVGAVLDAVPESARADLVGAMAAIRRTMGETMAGPIVLRPQRIGDLGWLIHRQGLLYNRQFGWNGDFEGLIARIYGEYHALPSEPPRDLWIAERDGVTLGSVFVQPALAFPGQAQLRMLYVEPVARGQGIGRLLVEQAKSFARDSGYAGMRLWTHTIQEAARRVYAAAGFAVEETMDEDNFGQRMTGEIWSIRFQ